MSFSQSKSNLLALGIDDRVFQRDSPLYAKSLEYGKSFASVHIVCRTIQREKKIEKQGNVIFYPIYSRFSFLFPCQAYFVGKRIMKDYKSWVVSADNPFEIGLIAWLLAKRAMSVLFLHLHTDFLSSHFRQGSWKEWVRYKIARFIVFRATCLRVVSERIKNSIISQGRQFSISKITVLPIFTDVSRFMDALPDIGTRERFNNYNFKMIAVGRFVDKEKNFSMLIKIMRDFVKICPGALLVLVGDGPDSENYKRQITNYKLERNVIIEPWKDNLPSFYKSFDIFLLSSNYEGWGRVVIEAMASGLPVVVTDVGLAGEVVRHDENGIVVPVGDKDAFFQACLDLYKYQGKRKKLIKRGFETVKNLSPKSQEEYLRLYRESLEQC